MGSEVYDFLSDSILFNESAISNNFSGLSDKDIYKELDRYREFCINHLEEIRSDITSYHSSLKAFSGFTTTDLDLLKQCAFYVDQFVVYDPLFPITTNNKWSLQPPKQKARFNRKKLVLILNFLKKITPMVASNYVKIYPTSYHFEPPEELPSYMSDYYRKNLPKDVFSFFSENATVKSLKPKKTFGSYLIEETLYPCREILVGFKNHLDHSMIYHLNDAVPIKIEGDKVEFKFIRPDEPPDGHLFKSWMNDSIGSAAHTIFHKTVAENELALSLNAQYLTNSEFLFELMQQIFPFNQNISTNTLNTLLKFELPFLGKIEIKDLMSIRESDGEVFQAFRLEMDKQFRDLRGITDENILRQKIENVFHELSEYQLTKVDQKFHSLRQMFFARTLGIFSASFVAAIPMGKANLPTVLALAVGALMTNAYQAYQQYLDLKQSPSFFLWKVLK